MKQLRRLWGASLIGVVVATSGHAQTSRRPVIVAQISQDDPAYKAAFEETLRKPADPTVLMRYAELAVKAGNLEGAISALERLLLIDADQPRIKLELGVLYFRLGSYEVARKYLESARASGRANAETKQRAAQFLADIDAAVGKSKFSGEFLAGLRYSTNANSGPSGAVRSFGSVVTTPTVSSQPDFSVVGAAAIRHRYDLGRQDNGALESDFAFFGSRQFQVSDADVFFLDFTTGPRSSPFGGWAEDITVKPYVTGRYVAVHDLTTYWAWGTGIETTASLGRGSSAALTVFGRRREFVNNTDVPNNDSSSGNEAAATLEFRADLTSSLTASFSTNFTRYIAMVASETYTEFGFGVTLAYRFKDPVGLNGRNWLATLSAAVERGDYDQPDPSVDPSVTRQQNDLNLGFVLGIPLDDRFTLVSQTSYIRRDATISNFAYDAFTTLAGVSWRF